MTGTMTSSSAPTSTRAPPLKQKMALGFKSLIDGARKLALGDESAPGANGTATIRGLFTPTTPEVDGDACDHDCDSCHVKYPRGFKIDESDLLYGHIKGWSTHVLVATGKSDWVRDVEDEKGSVMQAFGRAKGPDNGRMMLSASNIPTPSHTTDYSEPTTIILLPAFAVIENITPAAVPTVVSEYINHAPTNTSPLAPFSLPKSVPLPPTVSAPPTADQILARPSPHSALILLCSQKTRDARCGQSAPLLRKELERHLRPLGLFRDLDDERPGGVGIYFISHVGGHKYSANMMVYRRADAFGVDKVERARLEPGEVLKPAPRQKPLEVAKKDHGSEEQNGAVAFATPAAEGEKKENGTVAVGGEETETQEQDSGAAQCIWLARVKPEDCENIVRYTILQGKVVKPDSQLRGGFDREKGLLSW